MRKLIILAAIMLVLLSASVAAQVQANFSLVTPPSGGEIKTRTTNYTFSYNYSGTVLGSINATILRNGTNVTLPFNLSNNTIVNFTEPLDIGSYNWSVNISNGSLSNVSTALRFTVTPWVTFTITSPTDQFNSTNDTYVVNYTFKYMLYEELLPGNYLNATIYRNGTAVTTVNLSNNTVFNFTESVNNGYWNWTINVTNGSVTNVSSFMFYTVNHLENWTFMNLAPANGTTLISRLINYSGIYKLISSLGYMKFMPGGALNVTIVVNKTSIMTNMSVINNTMFNFSHSSGKNGYYEWYFNVSNGTVTNQSPLFSYNLVESAPTFWNVTLQAPAAYAILTSRAVNFSYIAVANIINATENISCSVYNKSSSSGTYTVLTSTNRTNASAINTTVNLANTIQRTWWYTNCTNTHNEETRSNGVSEVRIFDIDENIQTLSLGASKLINFSLNDGQANFTTFVSRNNFTLFNSSGSPFTCGIVNTGVFGCTNRT